MMNPRAVVLLSGGLDSTTCLAIAKSRGFDCYALSFNYGQRSQQEIVFAERIAKAMQVREHKIIDLDLSQIGGSALTDHAIAVPEAPTSGIPVTYVPARNTVFLSIALGWAEVLDARHIFTGVNAVDYSGYPDCRPAYIAAFERMANLATRAGVEGHMLHIETPLIALSKAEIVQTGTALGVDYSLTVSCYQADDHGRACGRCDACRLRKAGFVDAGVADPTRYQ
ncbi:7-cyano-7-deazaguanine synthase QueC [Permianibacter sp. IMCC34836]|nr:7-cyano-7-deazaguanine synthase QueC [Permianibacter fluminis]NQD38625.1 7-cyano-7-deazaguanine synthase QueC [Permianibacter fluminis]